MAAAGQQKSKLIQAFFEVFLPVGLESMLKLTVKVKCGSNLSPGLKVKWLGLKVKWPRPKVKSKVKSQVKVKSQKSKSKSNQIRLAEPESNVKWNQIKSQIRAPKVKSN